MSDRRQTPKSIRTREAILGAARELFTAKGFDRTTVREIGARAGIDAAMVIRYFGGKEALFALVAAPELQLPDMAEVTPESVGDVLVRHFLAQWEEGAGGGGLPVLLGSAMTNEDAAERLRSVFASQVMPAIARVGPAETAATRAGLVATQILGLAVTRYLLKLPPVVAMPTDFIVREIGATIRRYATGAPSLAPGAAIEPEGCADPVSPPTSAPTG
jgi:AcrR family transcriptional regulator